MPLIKPVHGCTAVIVKNKIIYVGGFQQKSFSSGNFQQYGANNIRGHSYHSRVFDVVELEIVPQIGGIAETGWYCKRIGRLIDGLFMPLLAVIRDSIVVLGPGPFVQIIAVDDKPLHDNSANVEYYDYLKLPRHAALLSSGAKYSQFGMLALEC